MAGKCDLPLHGLTVVVEIDGPTVYLGRYDAEDSARIVLRDVEVREIRPDESRQAVLARSARYGVFKNADWVEIPRSRVVSVRRLSDIPAA